jgi:predicted extracellular nuclease
LLHDSLTEIGYVDLLLSCGMGSVGATSIDLPVDDVSDLEAYESMLVTFPELLSATDNYDVHRYGEVTLPLRGVAESGAWAADPAT